MRALPWLLLSLSALTCTACNSVIGADPPIPPDRTDDRSGDNPDDAQALCGNGVVDEFEQCDDGNQEAGDGCEACLLICDGLGEALDASTGHCLRLAGAPVTGGQALSYADAAADCAAWHGALASVGSPDELAAIQLFGMRAETDLWLGGRNRGAGFTWESGEPWDYDAWGPDQPGADPCVRLDVDTLQMSTGPCEQALPYLCERPRPAEPAAG